ncbi:MAG: VOC family protein [Acidobacteria bacterium]|nr:VOC family protein [Acidobacteriota bacterium]
MASQTKQLTPMAFVSDVTRSIAFYEHLGFVVGNTFTPADADKPSWAWLSSGNAHLMITNACDPVVPEQQAILFYLYVDDVAATRDELVAAGLQPGPIENPPYAPHGEFRLTDPDGFTLMIMHT